MLKMYVKGATSNKHEKHYGMLVLMPMLQYPFLLNVLYDEILMSFTK